MRIGRKRHKARELLSRAEKVKLRELIEHIERETTGEICVMLLEDVADPKKFATDYFNHLGIGKKELDNGILILVVLAKRRIELLVGRGLSRAMPQAFLEQVINEALVPHFRDGKFGHGLHQAVEALGGVLQENYPKMRESKPGEMPGIVDLEQGERE